MLISNKTTFAQIVLHKLYLKQQIEVPLILLTTKTNLGKFTFKQLEFFEKYVVVGLEEPYDWLKPIISKGVQGPAPPENF